MPLNLPVWTAAGRLVLTAVFLNPVAAASQVPCPPAADTALTNGWRAYRGGSLDRAVEEFGRARRLCPRNLDAQVGLGFARLHQGKAGVADSLFGQILTLDSSSSDGWEGRARSRLRMGDTAAAVAAGRRALALSPNNSDLRVLMDRISPDWERSNPRPRLRRDSLQLVARTRGRSFEIATDQGWATFYLRGVNLGVALPGRYPSEFPTDSIRYAGWLDTLAAMKANTLRVYTILPPSFYRAVRAWNLAHPERNLWLVHGVWTELPPQHDFNHPRWKAEFQAEMRRVIDVIHGSAQIAPRPGHAAGRYDADVSRWVLGYIIGREWEPFAVKAYDARNGSGSYAGRYLRARQAPAMDLWLARQCDLMLSYEVDAYNALRPIAYTNWPTLDPLHHPTEAGTQEEAVWRRRVGRRSEAQKVEYENDVIGLDANLVEPTSENLAGWFASYHVYPYYPDFIMLDPGYRKARSSEGSSSYFGYLRDLVAHHTAIPTVIAEYGVPSSRGIAHLHPQGWSHGGHDESAMAAIDARLTREIQEAGAAGAILFAWMDEWFKKNWAVIDYEIPLDNTRQWHNVMDAEQNYGILGQYAGARGSAPTLGGDPARWRSLAVVQTSESRDQDGPQALRAGADESYLYLAGEFSPGSFPWGTQGIQLAIDVYQRGVGQHRLPRTGARSEVGFEFLVDLVSPTESRIRVTPEYNRHDSRIDPTTGDDFGRFSRRPVLTRDRADGRFDSLFIITNRARFGRDGSFYRAAGYDRGQLQYGTQSGSTLSDWYYDERAGLLEIRLAWDLLNVTDPSTLTLLHDLGRQQRFGTVSVQDFHIGLLIYQKGGASPVVGALPAMVGGLWLAVGFKSWRWRGWTEPRSHARLKPVYDSLRVLWGADRAAAPARPGRRAPSD